MLRCAEVFLKLKNKRSFKNILLFFDDSSLSLEIEFNSNNKELLKDIVDYYGFTDSIDRWGVEFDIFINGEKIINSDLNIDLLKTKDKLKIFYNSEGCFSLFSHLIIYEIDNDHDDDYFYRIELEKWSI